MEDLVRLTVHEGLRLWQDRMVCDEHKNKVQEESDRLARK